MSEDTFHVDENCSAVYRGLLTDEYKLPLSSSLLLTLTATLYDSASGAIINEWNKKNVLNTNGGTLDENGNFELLLTATENVVVNQSIVGGEKHVLLLEWTWGVNRSGKKRVIIVVNNLAKVP